MRSVLARRLGNDALGQTAVTLVTSALSANSYGTYGSALSAFADFCQEDGIHPLEATEDHLVRYTAWLGQQGTVGAASLQPYFSAINRYRSDHLLPPIEGSSLLRAARAGLAGMQHPLMPESRRVPLPAEVACLVLLLAESHHRGLLSAPSMPLWAAFRDALAVLLAFVFYARGEAGASCRVDTVAVDDDFITLYHYNAKGRRRLPAAKKLLVQLPRSVPCHDRLACLLAYYIAHRPGASDFLWSVAPSVERPGMWTSASTLSGWLSTVCSRVQRQPPSGFRWSSHSLRKGAASSASAVGVPLPVIRYMGGWATHSSVVNDYIDPTVLPDDAARFWFAWRSPLGEAVFPSGLTLANDAA